MKLKKCLKIKKEIEQPDKILKIVKEILNFNKETKKQQGLGLKILTPDQMLSRLPITLAQKMLQIILKKLKMKLYNYYILCTDKKKLTKNVYKSLVSIM